MTEGGSWDTPEAEDEEPGPDSSYLLSWPWAKCRLSLARTADVLTG